MIRSAPKAAETPSVASRTPIPIPYLIEPSPSRLGPRARLYPLAAQAQDADASPSSRGVHSSDVELRIIEQRAVDLPAHGVDHRPARGLAWPREASARNRHVPQALRPCRRARRRSCGARFRFWWEGAGTGARRSEERQRKQCGLHNPLPFSDLASVDASILLTVRA
jgi:hypothetical protein